MNNGEMAGTRTVSADLVSIVIPVFNGANYLAEAIDSALAQTWPATEVIVVDDGSTDCGATRAVIDSYGDRVRLVAKSNGGVASALNAGIAAMRGTWFSWLSHDDLYCPEKVEHQMAALASAPAGTIAFGEFEVIDADGGHLETVECCRDFDPDRALWAVLEGQINGCTVLAPADVLRAAGGFHTGLPTTQDYHLWFNLVRRHPLLAVPGTEVYHRQHGGQGSRAARHVVEAGLLWWEMLEQLTPGEMRALGGSELGFFHRLIRFLERSPYRIGLAAAQSRMARLMAAVPVTLAWATTDAVGDGPARMTLAAAGMAATSALVIDHSDDAATALALRSAVSSATPLIHVPGETLPSCAMEAALAAGSTGLIVLADASTTMDPAVWRQGLEAVAAGACEAWTLPRHGEHGVLPEPLSGLVVSRGAYAAALECHGAHGAAIAALARPVVSAPRPTRPARRVAVTPAAPAPAVAPIPGARLHTYRLLSAIYQALPWRPTRLARRLKDTLGIASPAPAPEEAPPAVASPIRARLIVLHGLGGGTLHYAELLGAHLHRHGIVPIFAWGEEDRRLAVSTTSPTRAGYHFALPDDLPEAAEWLRMRGVDRVDVLHAMGLDAHLMPLLEALGCPHDVTFLDYHLVAVTPHLMSVNGCTAARGQAGEARDLAPLLRAAPHPVIAGAANRVACSRDLAHRLGRLVPGLEVRAVRPPEPTRPDAFRVTPPFPIAAGERLRVLQLGTTAPHKGRQLLLDVGRIASERDLPIEVHVLGRCLPPPLPAEQSVGHVAWYGAFREEDLPGLIGGIRPHLAWFPAQAPETYGFALSDAMLLGLPIVAHALGAYAERLAGRAFTWSIPADRPMPAEDWIDLFLRLRETGLFLPPFDAQPHGQAPLDEGYYGDVYLR